MSEHGYVTALWVGSVVCVVSARASWMLSRGKDTTSPGAMAARDRELAVEEAELASARTVALEG